MAILIQKRANWLLILLLLFINSLINLPFFVTSSPQNIETYYPPLAPPPPVVPPSSPPTSGSNVPPTTPSQPPTPPPPPPSTSRKTIMTAVGVTVASTLVVAAAVFFLCTKYTTAQRKKVGGGAAAVAAAGGGGRPQPLPQEFLRFDGNFKGLIVDEDGLDVLYWRKLEGSQRKSGPFRKEAFSKPSSGRRSHYRAKSSSSSYVHPQDDQTVRLIDSKPAAPALEKESNTIQNLSGPSSTASDKTDIISKEQSSAPVAAAPPPPPPPIPPKKGPPPPPPPKKGPPLKKGGPVPTKPPQVPNRTPSGKVVEVSAIGQDDDQVKLKPLHWEKVNVNTDHSMVWDKIERGSFQYNGDMMEALFGYVATNRNTPNESTSNSQDHPSAKIFVLDSKRSQNIAIVIRSLGISRGELISGLQEGKGLNVEILEKLMRIVPTAEEKTKIFAFDGDVGRLADAESFLYHLLKAVPSTFTRANAMLFIFTYDSEIQQLKESLQTLDSACTELRNRGVFLKLLEAILKAGNRLNAGTTRGDAKAFNLSALRKLSDYKSSDGKTTLLHFVVHEVVRNEGRRCVMNRNNSLTRSNSHRTTTSEEPKPKEEQEKEFLKLGLPIVGGLSAEFSNVKKASTIDYDTITSTITSLTTRIAETRQLVLQCGSDGREEFVLEMKQFLVAAEGEIGAVKKEQTRVMEFVKKTTQYYQAGAFKDKFPLQMFAIVKDFLSMVDQACIDIARSLQQQRKTNSVGGGSSSASSASPSSPSNPDVLRTRVTFPKLPDHFLSGNADLSDSDDDH